MRGTSDLGHKKGKTKRFKNRLSELVFPSLIFKRKPNLLRYHARLSVFRSVFTHLHKQSEREIFCEEKFWSSLTVQLGPMSPPKP